MQLQIQSCRLWDCGLYENSRRRVLRGLPVGIREKWRELKLCESYIRMKCIVDIISQWSDVTWHVIKIFHKLDRQLLSWFAWCSLWCSLWCALWCALSSQITSNQIVQPSEGWKILTNVLPMKEIECIVCSVCFMDHGSWITVPSSKPNPYYHFHFITISDENCPKSCIA